MVAAFADSIGGSARIEHTSAKGTTIALHLPSVLKALGNVASSDIELLRADATQ
jgi:hypothetical protein